MWSEQRESFPEDVKRLIDLLGEPEEGELNYTGQRKIVSRLDALRELKRLEDTGVINPPKKMGGVNTHIHTSESFSIFRSPSEAAWIGYRSGLEVLGINDHYTIAGHGEFGEACKILGLRATFSIEAMAMSEQAKEEGERYNDPKNPGRIYLSGKGVTHDLERESESGKLLMTMRAALRKRCEEMTERTGSILREIDSSLSLSFEDVLRFTPRGTVTERHVAEAIAELINRRFPVVDDRKEFLRKLLGSFRDGDLSAEGRFQDLIRNGLLKAGSPAYVEEPQEAFPSLDNLVKLFRDYGAIPAYPVLGNPLTEKESNLDSLFDELQDLGIFAVEVIPNRNTRERLQDILDVAEKHGFPVFNGTEHNTKSPQPILDNLSKDSCFLSTFRRGAYLILGHQFLSTYAQKGYLNQEGKLTIEDKNIGMSFFPFVGRTIWPEKVLKWLENVGRENVFKIIFGLHAVLDDDGSCEWVVRPGFDTPLSLLDAIEIRNDRVIFTDEDVKDGFEKIARKFVCKKRSLMQKQVIPHTGIV